MRLISSVMTFLAGLCLIALMLVTFIDVAGRELISAPLTFSVEITKLLMGLTVCLAFGITTLEGRHISVDLIKSFISNSVFNILKRLSAALLTGFFGIIAWRLYEKADGFISDGLATPILFIPVGPFVYAMSLACFATAIIALLVTIKGSQDRDEIAEHLAEARKDANLD